MGGDTCGVDNYNVCTHLATNSVILLYCTFSCMLGFFLGCCAVQSDCEASAYWNPLAAWRAIKWRSRTRSCSSELQTQSLA